MLSDTEKRARLAKALECGGPASHTVEDVIELCHQGRARAWENGDGCIVTQIEHFPRFSAVRYWLISGCLPDCLAMEDRINRDAVERGCTVAIAMGRRGWQRAAASTGWRLTGYHFAKALVS